MKIADLNSFTHQSKYDSGFFSQLLMAEWRFSIHPATHVLQTAQKMYKLWKYFIFTFK